MAAIYARAVRAGKRTLESVPEKWRDAVKALLDEDESDEDDVTARAKHFKESA